MPALTSAERARLHRERQRRGLSVLTVVVNLDGLTAALMDDNRIGPVNWDARRQRRIIEDAVADVLDDYANTVTRYERMRAARGIFKS